MTIERLKVESRGQLTEFSAPVKIMEGVIQMSERRSADHLRSQCMFYVCDMLLSFETVCFECDWSRKSRPSFALFDLIKNYGRGRRNDCVSFFVPDLGPNHGYTFVSASNGRLEH